MTKLNSKGFGLIEGLLLVIIIGLIGGAGYYVYKANQEANESLDNTGNSEFTTQKSEDEGQTEENNLPEGFVEYTHEGLGFSFAYPQEWGELNFEKNVLSNGESGEAYNGEFSNIPSVTLLASSEDAQYMRDGFRDFSFGFDADDLNEGTQLMKTDGGERFVFNSTIDSHRPFDKSFYGGFNLSNPSYKGLQFTYIKEDSSKADITKNTFTDVLKTLRKVD